MRKRLDLSESNSSPKWQINAYYKHKAPHSKSGMRGFVRFSGYCSDVYMLKYGADDSVLLPNSYLCPRYKHAKSLMFMILATIRAIKHYNEQQKE